MEGVKGLRLHGGEWWSSWNPSDGGSAGAAAAAMLWMQSCFRVRTWICSASYTSTTAAFLLRRAAHAVNRLCAEATGSSSRSEARIAGGMSGGAARWAQGYEALKLRHG
jgi:hypothetical protein